MNAKHPLRSKTVRFGILVSLLAVVELAQVHLPALLVDVTPKTSAWITLGIGILIIGLRFVTKGPVTWRSRDADL